MADSIGVQKAKKIIDERNVELEHGLGGMYVKDMNGYLNVHHTIDGKLYTYYSENPQADTMFITSSLMDYTDLLEILQFYVNVSENESVDFLSTESEEEIKELSKEMEVFAPSPESDEEGEEK